jgi:Rps23 Pro-64 3,4-dihydroxylase Tpa1-like proline 4-hydroxylase
MQMSVLTVKRDVFPPLIVEELRKYLRMQNAFIPATVTGDQSWRSGRVQHIQELFIGKLVAGIVKDYALVIANDIIHDFAPSRCEVQLSSYGDGDYFRQHYDNSTPDADTRRISWVSYINAFPGPNPFSGGELVLQGENETTVYTPEDGETVFFASSVLHEIKPVSAPEGWNNRRFSANGWVS